MSEQSTPPVGEPPPAPAQTKWLPRLRVEIDVTPRWFAPGASFDDDLLAILAAWRDVGGDLRQLMVDFQAGLSGVRVVLAIPAGVSTDAIESARAHLQASLDALDLASQRRRAVTEAREQAVARRRPHGVPSPGEALSPPLPSPEPGTPPSGARDGSSPDEPDPAKGPEALPESRA